MHCFKRFVLYPLLREVEGMKPFFEFKYPKASLCLHTPRKLSI